jgi:hypothetical protein
MSYSFGNKTLQEEKNYINVKYADKEKAKSLGAKWNKEAKQWYITSNLEEFLNNFETKEDVKDDIKIDYKLIKQLEEEIEVLQQKLFKLKNP